MPNYLEQLGQSAGMSAASGALGMGMGLLLEGHNDRRQLKQQGKLQQLEIQGQKEMTDYNMGKQLQMWKDTSYTAQMEQLKLAGLNPGLLYGMGGGGGQSTGQAAGNVTGGHAPVGGGEAMGMGIQMMNMQLMKAQADKLAAETKNIEAQTGKTGVEIGKIGAETKSITQGIENQKAQKLLLEAETEVKNLDVKYLRGTLEDRMDIIDTIASKEITMLDRELTALGLDRATVIQKADIIKAEAIGALLRNALTEQQTEQSKAQISKWAAEIAQGWTGLSNEQKKIALQTLETNFRTTHPTIGQVTGQIIDKVKTFLEKNSGNIVEDYMKSHGKELPK